MSVARLTLQVRIDGRPLFTTPWEAVVSPTESQQLDKIEPFATTQENQALSANTLAVCLAFDQEAAVELTGVNGTHSIAIEDGGAVFASTVGQMFYASAGRVQGLY